MEQHRSLPGKPQSSPLTAIHSVPSFDFEE